MGEAPFVTVARAVKAHGLAGEIAFDPLRPADDLKWLVGCEVWFVPPGEHAVGYQVRSIRPGPKGPLVALAGVDTIEDAKTLSGRAVLAKRESVPEEYLAEEPDPLGLAVFDEERGAIGTVTDVIVTGANDVWVVEGDRFGEVLMPVIDDVVLDVDFEARRVQVRLLPGLIDGDDA